jgi:hypothetical protein
MCQEALVETVQRPKAWHAWPESADHAKQLKWLHAHAWKRSLQQIDLTPRQWLLVRRSRFTRIRNPVPNHVQEWVAAPGFTEGKRATRFENAAQLGQCALEVEMMQDGVAPDGVEAGIVERQSFAGGLHGMYVFCHVVGMATLPYLPDVAG